MSKRGKRIAPKRATKEGVIKHGRILNAEESATKEDWVADVGSTSGLPEYVDLRKGAPRGFAVPYDQGRTGSCVGQAVSKALHYYLLDRGKIVKSNHRYAPSPRFIWQASKETDAWEHQPTTMLQADGTYVKDALDICRKHGACSDRDMPMDSPGTLLSRDVFYKRCEEFKIKAYYAVSPWGEGFNMESMKSWLANKGPVVTRFNVDEGFMRANRRTNILEPTRRNQYGGHAAVWIGYGPDYFLLLNSWGTRWGNGGLVKCSLKWARLKATENYGIEL